MSPKMSPKIHNVIYHMKKILTIIALAWMCAAIFAKDYQVYGPQADWQ